MRLIYGIPVVLALLGTAYAQDPDPKKQQERIEALEKTVKELQQKQETKPAAPTPPPEGQKSPVLDRQSLNDQQEGVPRPGGETLDPKFVGFFAIPNTPVIMKINAKPRLDMTVDSRNAGDDNRFITQRIPVDDDPADAGVRSNLNAKGSQLRIDARAPTVAGNPRFYYQNDFYGSGGGEFPYRIQQLWGQIYNITAGFTYSVFEDPDAWPDTVDYEGPNAVLFARRALVRYQMVTSEALSFNFGVEQPDSFPTDLAGGGNFDGAVTGINHLPDFTANMRVEDAALGHLQVGAILRYLAANSTTLGKDETAAYGLSVSGVLKLGSSTSLTAWGVVGKGIGTLGNDAGFENTDIAYDPGGNLTALPYHSIMLAVTHHWNEEFRSTVSYGYVHVGTADVVLDGDVYNRTNYVSANVIWQLKKRLSVGAEVLYGSNEEQSGDRASVVRFQLGLVYSLFD